MKNYLKHIKILLIGTLLLTTSCDEGEVIVDQVTAETERGAILRTISIDQSQIVLDLDNKTLIDGGFSTTVEVQDVEDGNLVSQIEVYAGFRDNTTEKSVNSKDEVLLGTIPSSAGVIGEFGFPRFTYSVGYEELQTAVNVSDDVLFGGDEFTVRFELVLTDGRRFSFDNNTSTLTGSFFRSPFLYTVQLICFVPDDYFVGDYSMAQTGALAPLGIDDAFSQPVVSVNANSMRSRSIEFTYDPGGEYEASYIFTFDLICGEIQNFSGRITEGKAGCKKDENIGQKGIMNIEYDLADDSEFTIIFEDFNPDGGCGEEYEYETSITLTKL